MPCPQNKSAKAHGPFVILINQKGLHTQTSSCCQSSILPYKCKTFYVEAFFGKVDNHTQTIEWFLLLWHSLSSYLALFWLLWCTLSKFCLHMSNASPQFLSFQSSFCFQRLWLPQEPQDTTVFQLFWRLFVRGIFMADLWVNQTTRIRQKESRRLGRL